ncbi:hypothetical protein EV214_11624 [Marinisporobacter balticus]|uniref:Uncharacterized protein n=1 Tax=Marinisporobacter balticus TaxID=2018667 RepID=A0A4R2KKN8_9FIRM|nr:hypothetical protein EV214_11624 [Marinisporobacter balticus]
MFQIKIKFDFLFFGAFFICFGVENDNHYQYNSCRE